MSTRRRSRFCKSTRIRSICGVRGSDRIHSKDVSDALTEVLREDTCLPQAAGGNVGSFSCESVVPAGVASMKPTSPTGCDGRDRLSKKRESGTSSHLKNGNTKRFSSKPGQQEPVIGMSLEHINQSVNPRPCSFDMPKIELYLTIVIVIAGFVWSLMYFVILAYEVKPFV
ncbi:hypothetical protein F2Q70_00020955 [Brassica cretica]|uniref:Uncharacterized protein n=1 Tax=Brassica cretica TaxID=69181 RepID=A0A8S9GWT9_BRACR|nr:hypothetical protein F2Q70_00020955 [Brassica cretica]